LSEELREIYKEGQDEADFEEEFEEASAVEGEEEAFAGEEESHGTSEFSDTFIPEDAIIEEDDFEARMQKRRARVRSRKRRRKIIGIILIIAAFATLATMCGRDIVRLKAENIALQRQQKELEEERDRLRKEVESAGDREYVQDQARKQLRLLNPGELLFTFEDEEK